MDELFFLEHEKQISQLVNQTIILRGDQLLNALNNNPVPYGSYALAETASDDWGYSTASGGERHFLTNHHTARIRQNGLAKRVLLYINSLNGTTNLYIAFWRKNKNGTWDRIYQEDIFSKITKKSINTIELAQWVPVREGDYVGYGVKGAEAMYYQFKAISNAGTGASYFITESEPTATGFDWTAGSSSTAYMPVNVYGESPTLVTIGDSIIAGHPHHYSYIESTQKDEIESTIAYHISQAIGWTYQNMGIGSQTSTSIKNRFDNDAVALRPRIALISAGVNDLAGGLITEETYTGNIKYMLDKSIEAGILPIVLKILPWTNGTDEQMRTRDTWNAALEDLVSEYAGAILVDASTYVGVNRADGDEGNLWDINPIYDVDGVHFNAAGYEKIAEGIVDAIKVAWIT